MEIRPSSRRDSRTPTLAGTTERAGLEMVMSERSVGYGKKAPPVKGLRYFRFFFVQDLVIGLLGVGLVWAKRGSPCTAEHAIP